MAVEYQRGISVSSAVMSFEHEGLAFRRDFSEDSYRTLTAVDSAVMVLGAVAKSRHRGADPPAHRGLPAARRADLEPCRRARPPGPRPFDLLDEIEQSLALDVTPAYRPIGTWGATLSAPMISSPMPFYCLSAASTTSPRAGSRQ
jgi:peptide chain release factor 3